MIEQLGLDFDGEQSRQLARVSGRIAKTILEFCEGQGTEPFRMSTLTTWVTHQAGTAPSSPDRVLRSLRQAGQIRYTVLSRSESLYRIDWVAP